MNTQLARTELYFFNHVSKDHKGDRLELFARMAHENEQPVLVIANDEQLKKWKEAFPLGLFSYTRPDSANLRRNPFPENTAVLLDPDLSRQDLAFMRSKAMRDRINMTQVA